MKIKPLGFYVLVEMETVEQVSDGGIILPEDLINKEQQSTATGYVRAIGPTAYVGYPGCDVGDYIPPQAGTERANNAPKMPHHKWGLEIGDYIEYRPFEGKASCIKGYENYRYIPDSHIIGVISHD